VGGVAVIDPSLLDEVTALVEWPVALTGQFEERFLAVPAEALIASMKEHQKYFHVVDANGKLKNNFITVANIQSKDAQQIIDGNERVIRPRLSDAAFFFETDKKTTLAELRERLKTIVFQAQLGTIFDKTERVAGLAELIANQLSSKQEQTLEVLKSNQTLPSNAVRAAQLCKSDLVTNMVGEFDDMQGIAGYYYAVNDGENAEVAAAMAPLSHWRIASIPSPVFSALANSQRVQKIPLHCAAQALQCCVCWWKKIFRWIYVIY
jgi:glycyl-tRNA synthetase beta chain